MYSGTEGSKEVTWERAVQAKAQLSARAQGWEHAGALKAGRFVAGVEHGGGQGVRRGEQWPAAQTRPF